MQIVSLEAENIKGLRAVRIDTNGERVIGPTATWTCQGIGR
jgi:hypothetical protein